jgi:hypothetical protein
MFLCIIFSAASTIVESIWATRTTAFGPRVLDGYQAGERCERDARVPFSERDTGFEKSPSVSPTAAEGTRGVS